MPHSTGVPPGPIEAIINHVPRLKDGEPERILYPKTVGYRRYKFEPHTEQVNDMRGHEDEYKVDTHGFQLCKAAPIPEEVYRDNDKFKEMAYPEVKELLKKTYGFTSYLSLCVTLLTSTTAQVRPMFTFSATLSAEKPTKRSSISHKIPLTRTNVCCRPRPWWRISVRSRRLTKTNTMPISADDMN